MIEGLDGIIGGAGGSVVAFASSYALIQYRVKQLEKANADLSDELEKQIQAVNISKRSKFKEVKDDLKERIQITHERIDRTRDENNKKFDDMRREMSVNNTKLEQRITEGFTAINQRLDMFIQNRS